ncbi:MAG: hypothetical protein KF703_02780 [Actinobacteria bacterium]|nr:hypothetical protein [Actinomycetota bacterium]
MPSDDQPDVPVVPAGLLQSFADDDGHLAVLDVATGQLVDEERSVAEAFGPMPGTLPPVDPDLLEEARAVDGDHRGPEQAAAVVRLFAALLVRSPAAVAHIGADGLAGGEAAVAEQLGRFHLQLVELDRDLPGFVVGDVPVLHIDTGGQRFGFGDELDIADADLIAGPLTRTVAACFNAEPLEDVVFGTRKRVDAWNALFIRAARAEVAAHPDDARTLRQTHSRLDRLPPSILIG